MSDTKFEEWCLVEIMGHVRLAGFVSEQVIGGASFVRVDVPETEGHPAFSRMFGASAIYSISPIGRELAHDMASQLDAVPIQRYDLSSDLKKALAEGRKVISAQRLESSGEAEQTKPDPFF